jgi:hypothetical protein
VTESLQTAEELFDPDARRPDGTEAFLDAPQNASDSKALKAKAISDKSKALKEENDIRAVLSTPAGIRFISRLIGACGWNVPHFSQNNSVMCEIAGRRSIAWQLEQWISDTDLSLWFAVRRELELTRVKPKTSERSRS